MLTYRLLGKIIGLLTISMLLTSCLTQEEQDALKDSITDPPNGTPTHVNHPANEPNCFSETYHQPPAEISKKVDLLFVVDSSGSLRSERAAIGDGVDAFIEALPADVDARFGVMLAHGESQWSGNLYRHKSESDPLVLSSLDFDNATLRSIMSYRMRNVASEYVTDGGETGLYSVYKAFEPDNFTASQENGFFRDDSALVVVFVADENDICAVYPEDITPVYDPNRLEPGAKSKFCDGITPASVLNQIQSHRPGLPLLIGGVIYADPEHTPAGGENEVGYGYLETVELAGGALIDLSGGHFNTGLSQLGTLATKKVTLHKEFRLQGTELDPATLSVEVDGQVTTDFEFIEELLEIRLTGDAGQENSEIYISYCAPIPPQVEPIVISSVDIVAFGSTSITVLWFTDRPASSKVEAVNLLTGDIIETEFDTLAKTSHTMSIEGLSPNTVYALRVLSGDNDAVTASQPITLRTKR